MFRIAKQDFFTNNFSVCRKFFMRSTVKIKTRNFFPKCNLKAVCSIGHFTSLVSWTRGKWKKYKVRIKHPVSEKLTYKANHAKWFHPSTWEENFYFHSVSVRVCVIDLCEHALTKQIFFPGSFVVDTMNSDTKQYSWSLTVISIQLVFTIVGSPTTAPWNHTCLIVHSARSDFLYDTCKFLQVCKSIISQKKFYHRRQNWRLQAIILLQIHFSGMA